jgi:hypothetical protein
MMRNDKDFMKPFAYLSRQSADDVSQFQWFAVVYDLPFVERTIPSRLCELLSQPFGRKPVLISPTVPVCKLGDKFAFDVECPIAIEADGVGIKVDFVLWGGAASSDRK